MITYHDLHQQNHKITELSNVLTVLLKDRSLCDSTVTCDLFFQYIDLVKTHLEITDTHLYGQLLSHADSRVNNTAKLFMSGAQEIRRILNSYLKKWCNLGHKELRVKNYDDFTQETGEIFEIVLGRIQQETERLYPLVREVTGHQQKIT